LLAVLYFGSAAGRWNKTHYVSSYLIIPLTEDFMDIKPVKDAVEPQYPRKEEVTTDRIKVCVPLRWANSPAAKVALGTLAAMTLTACTPLRTAGVPLAPETASEASCSVSQSPTVSDVPMGEVIANTVTVAPLFLHGDGLGAFGCVMVAPPAFLSEDEALAVINNVAKDYGLKFSAQGAPEIRNVQQPVTNIYEPDNKAESSETMTLTPDFADTEHGVMIEFVSMEDVVSWHKDTGYAVSVESYDTQDAAAQLSEALEAGTPQDYANPTVGVLYDPCETVEGTEIKDYEAAEQQARALSGEQLSAQVKDFFEWLKSEGII
jgi:hypothetical protein